MRSAPGLIRVIPALFGNAFVRRETLRIYQIPPGPVRGRLARKATL